VEIPNKLLEEIFQYCKVNDIENVDMFMVRMLKQGFNVERYGWGPSSEKLVVTIPPSGSENINVDVELKPTIKEKDKRDLYGE
jgi:hypothetical protein